MTDVRLTALNPEDSQVYPVACNSSGELLVQKSDINLDLQGDLSVGGQSQFAGNVGIGTNSSNNLLDVSGGAVNTNGSLNTNNQLRIGLPNAPTYAAYFSYGQPNGGGQYALSIQSFSDTTSPIVLNKDGGNVGIGTDDPQTLLDVRGSAIFTGDVIVGSRSKSWMLVEQGGLCHMVEQTRFNEGFSVDPGYPKLRDVFNELDLIEKALSDVMEKLRLNPPAGWPVWDGSNES
jgi:hypothetical protein